MKITEPKRGGIGAEIKDLDLSQMTAHDVEVIKANVYQHKLLVFRDQAFDTKTYVEVAKKLGTPQIYLQANYHHPEHPEIFVSSNIIRDGKKIGVSGTGQYWHSDYSFMEEPLPLTMQYPQVSGKGRSTYYIDMRRVYETLPAHLKERVENGWAVHDPKMRYKVQSKDIDRAIIDILDELSQIRPPVQHPAVITHPVTRTKSLYVNEGFTAAIVGLSYEENKAFLAELFAFIKREEHIHTHPHQHGDILLWDNRSLIHMASRPPAGEPNETFRIGVYDGLPFHVH